MFILGVNPISLRNVFSFILKSYHILYNHDIENLALILIVGKFGFVSHTKHIAEATNMDLFHS